MDTLLLNAFIYIITLIIAINKSKRLNLYVMVWMCYSFVAIMGYISVKLNMHYSQDTELGEKLSFTPYLFAYFTTLLLSYPFSRMNERKINMKVIIPSYIKCLFSLSALLFFIRALFSGITAYVIANTIGFGEAYMMGHEGEYIDVFQIPLLSRFLRLAEVFTTGITPFYILYYFMRIAKNEGGFWYNSFFVILAYSPSIFSAIAGGSKGGLFFIAMSMIFYYIIVKPHMTYENKRRLSLMGFGVGLVLTIYVIIISLSRFEASTGQKADNIQQTNEIVHYLGEAFPNLGFFYWGKVDKHPYGRRFFPEFFYGENIEAKYKESGLNAKFDYWENTTHVQMATFKTFWGDWYVEYGLYGSFIAIILLYIVFYYGIFRKYYLFSYIGLIAFYYNSVLIRGCFTGSGLEGSSVHYGILLTVIISIYIHKSIKKQNRTHKILHVR